MGVQILGGGGGGGGLPQDVTLPLATSLLLGSRVSGDATDRFQILADGTLQWGAGVGATDVSFTRSGAGVLAVTGSLTASADIIADVGAAAQVKLGGFGPSGQPAVDLGTIHDTYVYRNAASDLRTNSVLRSDLDMTARNTLAAQVAIGAQGPASEAGMSFGNTPSARLYLSASTIRSSVTLQSTSSVVANTGGAAQVTVGSTSGQARVLFGSGSDTAIAYLATGVLGVRSLFTALTPPTITGVGIMLENVSAAPSTNPVGGGIIYCDAGALKYRGTAGTVTTIAPA